MVLRRLILALSLPIVGCKGDLKPGEYYRGTYDYLDGDSDIALAYRYVNDAALLAVLRVETDYVDLTMFRTDNNQISVWWGEEWFYRCSRADNRLYCTASPDGPVLFGTINNHESLVLFGSGDPFESTNTKEFAYEFTYSEPDLFRESDWAALRSDFDDWLNR